LREERPKKKRGKLKSDKPSKKGNPNFWRRKPESKRRREVFSGD